MKLPILGLLAASLLAGPTAASAADIRFYINGMFEDGAAFGGSFVMSTSRCNAISDVSVTTAPGPDLFSGQFSYDRVYDCIDLEPGDVGVSHIGFFDSVSGSLLRTFHDTIVFAGTYEIDNGFEVRELDAGGIRRSIVSGVITSLRPVPEPGTLALLGLGLAGLGVSRRRKAD